MPQLTIRVGRIRMNFEAKFGNRGLIVSPPVSWILALPRVSTAPGTPGRADHVIDEERDLRVLEDVSPLLPRTEVQAAHIDGVLVLVEQVGHRDHVRLALRRRR